MSDITGSTEFFDQNEVDFQSALSQPLATKIGANINKLIETQTDFYVVSDIVLAYLTEAEIQSQLGTDWILCDGRSVTGSAYETLTGNSNAPDNRGYFIRGNDSSGVLDPDAPRSTLSTQQDALKDHTHFLINGDPLNSTEAPAGVNTFVNTKIITVSGAAASGNMRAANIAATSGGSLSGGNETRPQNISLNFFIKIN